MTLLSVAAGAAAVLFVAYDIGLTVLHPTRRGPLSYLANRTPWLALRALASALGLPTLLAPAGPLAMGPGVAGVEPDAASRAEEPPDELREFLAWTDGVLAALARAHAYRHEPLLEA